VRSKKAKLNLNKWLGVGAALLLVPSLILNIFLLQKKDFSGQGYLVTSVIDGDTFEIQGGERIRLRHVDAPELEYCYGPEAKEKLESLIGGKNVTLKEKVVGQQNRGLYLVYVGNIFVNLEMLKQGHGRFHHDQSSQEKALKQAGGQAREEKLGLWGPKCYQTKNLENPDCKIKGNIDKNTYEDNKKYYFPGCPQYNFTVVEKDLGEAWFCSEAEAQVAGFVKAKNCP
jgi:micrococcal nuclease